MKTFYRFEHIDNEKGLWYDKDGVFRNRIKELSFCKCKDLPMPFEEEIVGYLSGTDTLQQLYNWFPKEEHALLKENGFYIKKYISCDYIDKGTHWVFSKETSIVVKVLGL